jgi:hydroxymethylpyrimidine kinase/phosphomethylpyrimidine kinase
MMTRTRVPIALTIGGSDSGGGAGIQADLKTFAAFGVHGTSVITCLTAQNPKGVLGVQPTTPALVRQQLDAIFAELPPAACKTGMLFSTEIVRAIVEFFRGKKRAPLIVDPVMVATSGARLLKLSAIKAICNELLPRATLVTPNLDEAGLLTGMRIRDEEDLRSAARSIVERFGCAALVKGGHLRGTREAVDIFNDGKSELLLAAPFVRSVSTHGTGCAYSAAIAAACAQGAPLSEAVQLGKQFITQAIVNSRRIGRHFVLGWS